MRGLILLAVLPMATIGWAKDRAELVEGVAEISAPGIPGTVVAFGPLAEPVVVGRAAGGTEAAVVATAHLGQGRIMALGHDGYFGAEALATADTGQFMRNAVSWLLADRPGPIGVVNRPDLLRFLAGAGFTAQATGAGDDPSPYRIIAMVHEPLSEAQQARLRQFVREGGGLLLASTGWGWQMITGRRMPQHPLNAITEPAGLIWADGMLERTTRTGFDARRAPDPHVHAGRALASFHNGGSPQALASVLMAGLNLSEREPSFSARLRELRAKSGDATPPSAQSPVTLQDPPRRLALALDTADALRLPVREVRAHPSAAIFPGAPPKEAPRIVRDAHIDPRRHGWHSLGLYAAPGDTIRVRVPQAWVGRGLRVQIGAHTDELWGLEQWRRAPAIVRWFQVDAAETLATNAFGGLVYLVLPEGMRGEPFQVRVAGAVEAPLFELGRTSLREWRERQRRLPGPWAEIASSKLVVTVPSETIRQLDDPEALMKFWDRVMDACADLAGWPRERTRPERIVADEQISVGYMHAGYPIMTHLDAAPLSVDLRRLMTEGSWGHFHELGHNHQSGDWTFDGTVEVTVNLFTTYVNTQVLGLPLFGGHPALQDKAAALERARKHRDAGAPFDKWKADPFLALTMYLELIDEFGWDPIRRVFAEYRALPANQRPRTDQEKRDQWLTRLSRAVGRDLTAFFRAWGVPATKLPT